MPNRRRTLLIVVVVTLVSALLAGIITGLGSSLAGKTVLVLAGLLLLIGVVTTAVVAGILWSVRRLARGRGVETMSPLLSADRATRKAAVNTIRDRAPSDDPRIQEIARAEARRSVAMGPLLFGAMAVVTIGALLSAVAAEAAWHRAVMLAAAAVYLALAVHQYRFRRASQRYLDQPVTGNPPV